MCVFLILVPGLNHFFSSINQVSTWFFTTFSVSGLKDKIHHVDSLHQLFSAISPEQIDFPPFVLEYDARVRSTRNSSSPRVLL